MCVNSIRVRGVHGAVSLSLSFVRLGRPVCAYFIARRARIFMHIPRVLKPITKFNAQNTPSTLTCAAHNTRANDKSGKPSRGCAGPPALHMQNTHVTRVMSAAAAAVASGSGGDRVTTLHQPLLANETDERHK